MKKLACLILLTSITLAGFSQKYKRSTSLYDFSFTKEGKMKFVLKPDQKMAFKLPQEVTAVNELVLQWNEYLAEWTPVADGKIRDSVVTRENTWGYYSNAICFIKKGDKLVISEPCNAITEEMMEPDPATGEPVNVLDDYGIPLYTTKYSGGYSEMINLKDGKSIMKREAECLTQIYGDRFLFIHHQPAEDTYYDVYSLIDLNGKPVFDHLGMEDIYQSNDFLSNLISTGKADKILFTTQEIFYDQFAFLQNGKMGFSSVDRGVIAEPQYEFMYAGNLTLYLENGMLKTRLPNGETLEAREAIQTHTYQMEYFTEYFVDGKMVILEENEMGGYGNFAPSFLSSETFLKVGHLIIYSYPYQTPEGMYYDEGMETYIPTESELGMLVIYDTQKKEIIFSALAHSLVNYTKKGFLIQRLESDGNGAITSYHSVLDANGKFLHRDITRDEFAGNPKYLLELLPAEAKVVSYQEELGTSLSYMMNGKLGMFNEYSSFDVQPELKWTIGNMYNMVRVYPDKVTGVDTVSYSGDKPYFNQVDLSMGRNHRVFGNSRTYQVSYTEPAVESTNTFNYSLTDTSSSLESIEFKGDFVIQNLCYGVRSYPIIDYDYMTGDELFSFTDNGDTLLNSTYHPASGVFNKKTAQWIVPANYFKVLHSGKYFIASGYDIPKENLTEKIFKKAVSTPIFYAYDENGTLLIKGTAAEVKKKIGIDPKTLTGNY